MRSKVINSVVIVLFVVTLGVVYFTQKPRVSLTPGTASIGTVQCLLATPRPPTNITVMTVTSDQVNLIWSDWSDGEFAEEGYIVQTSSSANGTFVDIEVEPKLAPNTTNFQHKGLTPGTTYFYRIVAYNCAGRTPTFAAVVSATTLTQPSTIIQASSGPASPTDLVARPVSSSRIDLSWSDNSDNELGFIIYRSLNGIDSWSEITPRTGPNVTSYSDSGLSPNTTYYYKIRAVNSADYSRETVTSYAKTAALIVINQNIDTVKPVVRIISPDDYRLFQSSGPGQVSITVEATASDNVAIDKITLFRDCHRNTFMTTGVCNGANSIRLGAFSGSERSKVNLDAWNLSPGVHSFYAKAVDTAGNFGVVDPSICIVRAGSPDVCPSYTRLNGTPLYVSGGGLVGTPTITSVTPAVVGEPVNFTGTVIDSRSVSPVLWNFGDAVNNPLTNTSISRTPTHIYTAPGSYTVTFTNTFSGQSVSRSVTVSPVCVKNGNDVVTFMNPVSGSAISGRLDITGCAFSYPYAFIEYFPINQIDVHVSQGDSWIMCGVSQPGHDDTVVRGTRSLPSVNFSTSCDTATMNNGQSLSEGLHTIRVTVNYDLAAAIRSQTRPIMVNNQGAALVPPPPSPGCSVEAGVERFVTPLFGSVLSQTTDVCFRAHAGVGRTLSRVALYINTFTRWTLIESKNISGALSSANVDFSLNTANHSNGPHTLLAAIYDTNGLVEASHFVQLPVSIINVSTTDPGISRWFNEVIRPTDYNSASDAVVNRMKIDNQGDVIMVGKLRGTADFKSRSGITCDLNKITKSARQYGGYDVFIAKYTRTGCVQAVVVYEGGSDSTATAVAIDSDDNILVTGDFFGTVNFGVATLTSGTSIHGNDIFILKLDKSLVPLWVKKLGGGHGSNYGNTIAVDGNDNVIVGGTFYRSIDLGNGVMIASVEGVDGFVSKFNSSGNFLWRKHIGGLGNEQVKGVAVDSQNNIVVIGYGSGVMNLGGKTLPYRGGMDLFIVKYTSEGGNLWSKSAGGLPRAGKNDPATGGRDTAENVTIDTQGNIYVTGNYHYSINLGGGLMTAPIDKGSFVAKYSNNVTGDLVWSRNIAFETTSGDIDISGVAVDSSVGGGNVVVTGTATGGVNFGGNDSPVTYGESNFFVAKYSPSNALLWAKRSASQGRTKGMDLDIDNSRNVIATGYIIRDTSVPMDDIPGGNVLSITGFGIYDQINKTFLMEVGP